jgi:hypothetical protein
MLKYKTATGTVHATSLTEALDWLTRFPAVPPPAVKPSPAQSVSFFRSLSFLASEHSQSGLAFSRWCAVFSG